MKQAEDEYSIIVENVHKTFNVYLDKANTIKEKLLDRAKRNGEKLQEELPNLKKLKQVMDDYIDGKEPTIKLVILQDFTNELGNILREYQKIGDNETMA